MVIDWCAVADLLVNHVFCCTSSLPFYSLSLPHLLHIINPSLWKKRHGTLRCAMLYLNSLDQKHHSITCHDTTWHVWLSSIKISPSQNDQRQDTVPIRISGTLAHNLSEYHLNRKHDTIDTTRQILRTISSNKWCYCTAIAMLWTIVWE